LTRNYSSGPKRIPGTVLRQTGPVGFNVNVGEKTRRRHLDQICETNVYPAMVSDTTFGPQPTTNTDVVTPAYVIPGIPAKCGSSYVDNSGKRTLGFSYQGTTKVETSVHHPAERRYPMRENRNPHTKLDL
ncbi:hypothetical protein LSAT2_011395, partial [Lamellibrachia satsuma]